MERIALIRGCKKQRNTGWSSNEPVICDTTSHNDMAFRIWGSGRIMSLPRNGKTCYCRFEVCNNLTWNDYLNPGGLNQLTTSVTYYTSEESVYQDETSTRNTTNSACRSCQIYFVGLIWMYFVLK